MLATSGRSQMKFSPRRQVDESENGEQGQWWAIVYFFRFVCVMTSFLIIIIIMMMMMMIISLFLALPADPLEKLCLPWQRHATSVLRLQRKGNSGIARDPKLWRSHHVQHRGKDDKIDGVLEFVIDSSLLFSPALLLSASASLQRSLGLSRLSPRPSGVSIDSPHCIQVEQASHSHLEAIYSNAEVKQQQREEKPNPTTTTHNKNVNPPPLLPIDCSQIRLH